MTGPLYLYGVVLAEEHASTAIKGVEGSEVEAIEHEGIAALASRVEGGQLSAAREVRAHWRVLQEASETATVVPIRFGTVLQDEQAVCEEFLAPNAVRLHELLASLAGCVQLTVAGSYDEEELIRDVARSSRAIAGLSQRLRQLPQAASYYERIRLGELVSAEIARLRAADTDRTLQILRPSAEAARAEEPKAANSAFDLSFLVKRSREPEFSERVMAVAGELGERIDVRYVGPLPPYSFVDDADLAIGIA